MLTEALPEKDWTPWQRENMRNWNRLWTRDKQQLRIGRWIDRQERTHDWVCLADIADWCARRPGDIKRDPARLTQAYSDLERSILQGEFSEGGRLKVIYVTSLPPLSEKVKVRLDAARFREWLRPDRILIQVVESCWVSRALGANWLKVRRIDSPPWLVGQTPRANPAYPQVSSTSFAKDPEASLSRAKIEDVHNAIAAVNAAAVGKKPPNLKELPPLVKAELGVKNQTATWALIQKCAEDPRHASRRRPRGRTLKSEQTRQSSS